MIQKRKPQWRPLLRLGLAKLREDRVFGHSAQLAFYLLLSLFPLLLFVVTLVGLLLQSEALSHAVLNRVLASVLPLTAANLIDTTLTEIASGSGPLKLFFAVLFGWWSTSQAMRTAMTGINMANGLKEQRPWWKRVAVSSGMTGGVAALTAAALVALVLGRRAADYLAGVVELGDWVSPAWVAVRWVVILAYAWIAFTVGYAWSPDAKRREWHWLSPGTALAVGMWFLASLGFQLYVHFFHRYSATYGSLGAVIVLMMWFYLSSIAFFVGAEINASIGEPRDAGRRKTIMRLQP